MKYLKSVLVVVFALGLTSCSFLNPVAVPALSTYSLSGMKSVATKRAQTKLTLMVSQPIANPGYDTDHMIYVNVPFKLKSFADNQWVAPPSEMLLPILAQAVSEKSYFHAVVTPPFTGLADYRLAVRLLMLQQDFLQPLSRVRFVVIANLMSNRTNRVIATRRFQAVISAPGNNPYSGVLAANRAVNTVSQNIASFVLRTVRAFQHKKR